MLERIEYLIEDIFEMDVVEQTDVLFRLLCFGLAGITLLYCLFTWNFTRYDLGFVLSMILTYALAKLYLTLVEVSLPG